MQSFGAERERRAARPGPRAWKGPGARPDHAAWPRSECGEGAAGDAGCCRGDGGCYGGDGGRYRGDGGASWGLPVRAGLADAAVAVSGGTQEAGPRTW
ncbi:hypothetical protein M2169_005181 [Streptomyces sp. MJP52]|nr:hypothetical protein [Streptomyces sp. MJP52]